MSKKNIFKVKASQIRKELIEKFYLLKEGHPGSVFSILDVLIVLYYGKFIRLKGKKVIDDVIMSKGHATVGQYPILKDLRFWLHSLNYAPKLVPHSHVLKGP